MSTRLKNPARNQAVSQVSKSASMLLDTNEQEESSNQYYVGYLKTLQAVFDYENAASRGMSLPEAFRAARQVLTPEDVTNVFANTLDIDIPGTLPIKPGTTPPRPYADNLEYVLDQAKIGRTNDPDMQRVFRGLLAHIQHKGPRLP